MAKPSQPAPFYKDTVRKQRIIELLAALPSALSDRERYALSQSWGIGAERKTFREIAGDMGVSQERVRQLARTAEDRLKYPANRRCS